jgi:hypothetical protein
MYLKFALTVILMVFLDNCDRGYLTSIADAQACRLYGLERAGLTPACNEISLTWPPLQRHKGLSGLSVYR